jgi:hypothetical protein
MRLTSRAYKFSALLDISKRSFGRGERSARHGVLAIGQDPACAAIVLTASASAKDPGGEVLLTESAAKILKISQRTKPGIHLDAESQYPFETRANEEPNETFD